MFCSLCDIRIAQFLSAWNCALISTNKFGLAFLYQVATQTAVEAKSSKSAPVLKKPRKENVREDLEQLDSEELYYKYMEENPDAGRIR